VDAERALDPNPRNNEVRFEIRIIDPPPRMPDLALTITGRRLADPPIGPLIVTFTVRNFGARPAGRTRVEIRGEYGEVLGRPQEFAGVAANRRPSQGEIRIPVEANWIGGTRRFTGIVDPDETTGDTNLANNVDHFSFTFKPPASFGDGFTTGTAVTAAAATLIALVIWGIRKRTSNAPQQANAPVRGVGRHDAGTQSIRPGSGDVVLPSLRLRPMLDAGAQWVAFERAEPKS
jgi:hypothetical protein